MSIVQELEKLTSLRDRGDLSQVEYEVAKERLLSGNVATTSLPADRETSPSPKQNGSGQTLLIAILSTVAALFAAGSAVLDPTPVSFVALVLFAVASTLNWMQVSRVNARARCEG